MSGQIVLDNTHRITRDSILYGPPDSPSDAVCHSGTPAESSYVLRAVGLGHENAYATPRIAAGRTTAHAEAEHATRRIEETVGVLRKSWVQTSFGSVSDVC